MHHPLFAYECHLQHAFIYYLFRRSVVIIKHDFLFTNLKDLMLENDKSTNMQISFVKCFDFVILELFARNANH